MRISLIITMGCLAATIAQAVTQNQMSISDIWVRAVPESTAVTGAFMNIENLADTDDTLKSVTSPACKRAEIHQTITKNGMAMMAEVKTIKINKKSKLQLEPGSFHIMLFQPKLTFHEGQKIPLVLTFEKAGKIEVNAIVKKQ